MERPPRVGTCINYSNTSIHHALTGQYEYFDNSLFSRKVFHFIILCLSTIKEEAEKMFIIAHEIAHFICGHFYGNIKVSQDIELEVDLLCEK